MVLGRPNPPLQESVRCPENPPSCCCVRHLSRRFLGVERTQCERFQGGFTTEATALAEIRGTGDQVPDVSVIIPFFNEEDSVPHVVPPLLQALTNAGLQFEALFVDNGSRDATGDCLQACTKGDSRVRLLRVEINRGYGYGVLQALAVARGRHCAYLCGDGQVRPEDVAKIIGLALANDLPFVKARRIQRLDGARRAVMSTVYNGLMRARFGVRTWDTNATPKVVRSATAAHLDLCSPDHFLDAELTIKLHRLGIDPVEVPVVFYPRTRGESKVKTDTIVEFLRNMCNPREVRTRLSALDSMADHHPSTSAVSTAQEGRAKL